ncbi:MAG TPA: hypothetical protein VLA93_22660 [Pyrinomonadaceae bacterium]|nr:hypothetical protein [Pyrinomonadaceae bacterium]
MQRWNWFLAADLEGKWITTKGYAEVTLAKTKLNASLRYESDTEGDDPYHIITAVINKDETVNALVSSPGRQDIDPFRLQGTVFRGVAEDETETVMILLTDGTTVIGLTAGPRSHESNL